jgi:hypothetical protein
MKIGLFRAMVLFLGASAIASCESSAPTGRCNEGREEIQGECCVDANYNGICDDEEPPFYDPDVSQPGIDTLVRKDIGTPIDTQNQDVQTPLDLFKPDIQQPIDTYTPPDISPETINLIGEFGDPCNQNSDCLADLCLEVLGDNVCTTTCIEYCPSDWTCQYVDNMGDETQGFCFPSDFSEEICDNKDNDYDGLVDEEVTLPCGNENGWGYCEGEEICTNGTWEECNAPIPSQEECNNIDDDCDGMTDNGIDLIINQCPDGSEYRTICVNGEWSNIDDCDGNGQFGDPCYIGPDCESGTCLNTNIYGPICTESCETGGCIEDFICASSDICIPKYDRVGGSCEESQDCCHPADFGCDYAICSSLVNLCTVTCTVDCGPLADWDCTYLSPGLSVCLPE